MGTAASRPFILTLLLLSVMVLLVCTGVLADLEPNDDRASAEVVQPGQNLGSLTKLGDEHDFYKFVVTSGQVIRVNFTSYEADYFLYAMLTDMNEAEYFELVSVAGGTEEGVWHTSSEFPDQFMFLEVMTLSGSGDYSFDLDLSNQDDGGSGRDAGENTTTAEPIKAGKLLAGMVADGDIHDTYSFSAGEGEIIRLEYFSPSAETYLALIDPSGCLTIKRDMSEGLMRLSWYIANETVTANWYIRIWYERMASDYSFRLELGRQDDAHRWVDAPADVERAIEVDTAVTIEGHLEDEDLRDAYKVRLDRGAWIEVHFSSESYGDVLRLELVSADGSTLLNLTSEQYDTVDGRHYTSNDSAPCWYYLVVSMGEAPASYEFAFDVGGQDDAGTGWDVASVPANALHLDTVGDLQGYLRGEDAADAYSFDVLPGDIITIGFTSDAVDGQTLTLLDPGEEPVIEISSMGSIVSEGEHWTSRESVGGKWFIAVSMVEYMAEAFGGYQVNLSLAHQDDAGSGGDVARELASALDIEDGAHMGTMGGEDDRDSFSFPAQGGWLIVLRVITNSPFPIDIDLFGADGNTSVAALEADKMSSCEWEGRVPVEVTPGSRWYIQLSMRTTSVDCRYTVDLAITRCPYDVNKPVILAEDLPNEAVEGRDRLVSVLVTDDGVVAEVVLHFRTDLEPAWIPQRMALDGDEYVTIIPKERLEGCSRVLYYIEARDLTGNVASLGSERTPLTMEVNPPQEDSPGPALALALAALALAAAEARRRR